MLCHGPQQQMSGLRLDQKDARAQRRSFGADILPGNSADSRLIRLVAGLEKKVMPPMGARLTAEEVGLLRAWIDQGVDWPASASAALVLPEDPAGRPIPRRCATAPGRAIPSTTSSSRGWNTKASRPRPKPGKLHSCCAASVSTSPACRPLPKRFASILSDNRPDAYERLVDRLLDSPHYGEKWARYWLDLARYADSDGYEKDRTRPWAWRYRQWVIEALNRDMPFDEFTIEQLAGDLLPNRNLDTLVATGFNRNTLTNREGGTDPEQFRDEQVLDRAATLGTVWLGLTVGCAQCHNHKFDPISQKEFYQLTAFFNTQEEVNIQAPLARGARSVSGGRGRITSASAARCWKSTRFPKRWPIRKSKLREAALASRPSRGLGLRVRRVHPHRGQRAQGPLPGPRQAQRSAADRDPRRLPGKLRQPLSQGALRRA